MAVLFDELPTAKQCGIKDNLETVVLARLDVLRNVGSVRGKHVFSLEHLVSIEADRRKGIKAVKNKIRGNGDARSWRDWGNKFHGVDPCLFANPLYSSFVEVDKGVGDSGKETRQRVNHEEP